MASKAQVDAFIKRTSIISYSKEALNIACDDIMKFAKAEGLTDAKPAVPVETARRIAGKLDALLLQASKSASAPVDAKALKTALGAANLDKATRTAIENAAKRADTTFKAIDKFTVGGRTFFFDDQSAALNNLPASIVDKIRVIDRESESTRATGVQDGNRERVLDVALKKEYEQGWFGNAGLKGGTTVGDDKDDPLRDDRGLLYSANALVSAYTEKDQVTVIGNVQNVNDSNGTVFVVVRGGEATSSADQGISTAAQLGVNVNSSRIKDVESTVSANYKFTDTDSGTRSSRTTHQEGGDILSTNENSGSRIARSFTTEMEFEKEKGKVWFHFRPAFSYSDHDGDEGSSSETFRQGGLVNSSENTTHTIGHYKYMGMFSDVSFRELGGSRAGCCSSRWRTATMSATGTTPNSRSCIRQEGQQTHVPCIT